MTENLSQNNIKNILGLASLLSVFFIVGILTIYPVLDVDKMSEQIKIMYDNDTFYMGGKCGFKGGYKSFIQYSDRQQFELDELNILQPTYAIIQDIDSSNKTANQMMQQISFIKFQRTGITSFKPIEEYGASVRNKTLAETIEIIKKYNLLEENPDSKNIIVVPPKSPEELAKIAEQYCNQNNFDEERKKSEEEYNNASPSEKIQLLEKDITEFQKELSETTSESDKKLYLRIIEQMQTEIQLIKDENGLR